MKKTVLKLPTDLFGFLKRHADMNIYDDYTTYELNKSFKTTDKEDILEVEQMFPNGFDFWQETHYEIISEIAHTDYDSHSSKIVRDHYDKGGTGGMYDLAKELTDKFENLHKGRIWDGEYFEEIEKFLQEELYD